MQNLQNQKKRKAKKTALIRCHSGKPYWTTQDQFWDWVRSRKVVKTGDRPLTGRFVREDEEALVVMGNTVLSLVHPNHLREALASRRLRPVR